MEEETHKTIYSFKWGWLDKYFKHDKRILNAVLRRATSEIHKQFYGDHCGNYFSNDVFNEFIRRVENDPTYLLENRLDFSSREYSPITEVPFFCSDGRVKNHDHYERELGILSKKMNKGIIQKYEYLHVSGKIRGVNAYHFSVIEQYKKQIRKEEKRINKLKALSKKENRMNELIVIKKAVIGTEEVNSVNARELYEFLESKQEFAHWIKAKVVDNPFFQEGSDYCLLENVIKRTNVDSIVFDNIIKNPKGGRPRVDYALTIDTAKKVAMAEQTSRGNEVREYFIACEKKLKEVVGKSGVSLNSPYRESLDIMNAYMEVGKLLGTDEPMAKAIAVEQTRRVTGIDYRKMLPLANIQEIPVGVRQLSKELDIDENELKLLLTEHGYMTRTNDKHKSIILTEKAKSRKIGTSEPFQAPHSDHVGYQTKWFPSAVKKALNL